jgi:uncharacterized ion transporter superfamily protein YfcC
MDNIIFVSISSWVIARGKIENKTQDEDKQNKKDNTEIQKDDQHGPHQTVGSGMGAREG